MEEEPKNNPLKDLFNSANSTLIIIPPDPSQDLVAAGLSLHLSLASAGKKSQIGCSGNINIYPEITKVEEVTSSVGNQNLQINFNFSEDHLEKVDYDITPEGKFSLIIKPKSGFPVPDVKDVKFSYSGANADLVIVLGIGSLEELGKIYADEKKFLDNATILSVNTIGTEAVFTPNMFHLANITFTELICLLLQRINLAPSSEASSNLLTSIFKNTSNLTSPKMTPETFDSISFLMKNGARLPLKSSPSLSVLSPDEVLKQPARLVETPPFFDAPPDWQTPKIFRSSVQQPVSADKL